LLPAPRDAIIVNMKIASRRNHQAARQILMVGFDDAQILDITGPLEVFSRTSRWLIHEGLATAPAYRVALTASCRGSIVTSSGLKLIVERAIGEWHAPIDTLIVAGGRGVPRALRDRELLEWTRKMSPRARRLCSVCTGAFVLAEAKLLDGRRATTHWRACDELAASYPQIKVETDPIFVRDGNVFTSAGVTAGIDLALALVEEDHGRRVALAVARELVMFLRRPGGQSQFSVQLAAQAADREPIRDVQVYIVENPGADLSIARLARRAAMSPRNFARVFVRETGLTPADFAEQTRVEAARRRLEESSDGIEEIAARCGFGTRESMRRAFMRRLKVAPSQYRNRFHRSAAA
jgi:transcriptional regulator GlxA family with amidase domain